MIANSHPLVTIGMLSYNSAKTIREALNYLVNQDYPNIELVIIDDCSEDDSYEICLEYQSQYKFIKTLKNSQNIGAWGNFFELFKHVKGDFFLWACPDDWWAPDFLSKIIGKLSEDRKASVGMSAICFDIRDKKEPMYYKDLEGSYYRKRPLALAYSVLKGKDSRGNSVSYNQFIHSVVRTSHLRTIFPKDFSLLVLERFIIVLMIFSGGISYVPEILHEKYEPRKPFFERHPEDPFAGAMTHPYAEIKGVLAFQKYILCSQFSLVNKVKLIILSLYEAHLKVLRPKFNEFKYKIIMLLLRYKAIKCVVRFIIHAKESIAQLVR